MKTIRNLLGLWVLVALSGCANCYTGAYFDNCTTGARNSWLAHLAWKDWCWAYSNVPHTADFSSGFKAGYVAVCEGKEGCQPTHPPRRYWNVAYQNAEGHCRVNSWFDGYTHGAICATGDGFAGASMIPVSPVYNQGVARTAYDRETALRGRPRTHAASASRSVRRPTGRILPATVILRSPSAARTRMIRTTATVRVTRTRSMTSDLTKNFRIHSKGLTPDDSSPLEDLSPLEDATTNPLEQTAPLDGNSTSLPGYYELQDQAGRSAYADSSLPGSN